MSHAAPVYESSGRCSVTNGASSVSWPFLARGRHPIVAGPWLSEVGFEVLYWIPFLRWFEDRYRVDRERVIAVSRGGASSWYADVAGAYVDIFDHLDPETFAPAQCRTPRRR